MTRCKFLSEADGPAGFHNVNDIALSGKYLEGIWKEFQLLRCRRATAVIINDHWIFLRFVEIDWKHIEALDGVASRRFEIPVVDLSQCHIAKELVKTDVANLLGFWLF